MPTIPAAREAVPLVVCKISLDGVGEITIGEKKYMLQAGESILMPANIEHAVFAPERFKMFLVVSF